MEVIEPGRKDRLIEEHLGSIKYQKKANINGACLKLLTDNYKFYSMFTHNFDSMSDMIRPHGRVFSFSNGKERKMLYEPRSKTCLIFNVEEYGKIKSLALAVVGDFFEDYHSIHRRFSVHGAAVEKGGRGLALIGEPESGKTTLGYGMLTESGWNFLSDDWFYVRLFKDSILAHRSEKNSYIRKGLGKIWRLKKLETAKLSKGHRSIVNISYMMGEDKVREVTNLKEIFLLRKKGEKIVKAKPEKALEFLKTKNFCNPHLLVKNERKNEIRLSFFQRLLNRTRVFFLNTETTDPQEAKELILEKTEI